MKKQQVYGKNYYKLMLLAIKLQQFLYFIKVYVNGIIKI